MTKNILEYLEHSARKYPDKIAVEDENTSCTYEMLLKNAQLIGANIATRISVRKPIPIFMEKGVDTLQLFMGTLYAGCFYVLLDIKQPATRLKQILETLDAQVLITKKMYAKELEHLEFTGAVYNLDELLVKCESEEIETDILQDVRNQALDIDPMYGIFTSGSTGVPKGVVVSHRSVIDFIEVFTETIQITKDDVIGNQAPFDFDVSVKDIYTALKVGATLQIIPRRMFSFPTQLLDYLEEKHITTLIWAVSALCILTTLKGFEYKIPGKINKVLFSGEVMPAKHLRMWQEAYPNAMFVNLYGPTEITCNCTYYIVKDKVELGDKIPIGKAFPNEKVFLLSDDNKEVTKANQLGELCVSGTALSLGYFNNQKQTEHAFVQNPLNPYFMELIYRTGDLAYYNEKSDLCFASRKDFQIKHMGHRIELGEIDAALEQVEQIRRSCCVFHEEKGRIVCFYEGTITKREIVTELKTTLPAYMIPNKFVELESLPITKNGKIDRKELLESLKRGKG